MMPRAFLGLSSVVLGGLGAILLASAWNESHGRGAWTLGRWSAVSAADANACPYFDNAHGAGASAAEGSIRAYAAIESALAGGSLREVPENATRIAKFFRDVNPDIAASALRLTRLREVPAARAEFRRLTDLFSQSPGERPAADGAAPSLLEI